jgi:hypothetical protein
VAGVDAHRGEPVLSRLAAEGIDHVVGRLGLEEGVVNGARERRRIEDELPGPWRASEEILPSASDAF